MNTRLATVTLAALALAAGLRPALAQDDHAGHDHAQPETTPPTTPPTPPKRLTQAEAEAQLLPTVTVDPEGNNEVRIARSANGLILFPALVNGRDMGWWMLDTGTTHNVIDARAARELGMGEAGAVVTKDYNGIEQNSALFAGFTLTTGNITIEQPIVLGVDMLPIASSVGQSVVGIIGASTLSQIVLQLDYSAPLAHLHDPATFDGSALEWTPVNFAGASPVIDAEFMGNPGTFVINTGLTIAVNFSRDTVRNLKLLDGRETRDWVSVWVGGRKDVQIGFIEQFELLGREYRQMPAIFEDPDGFEGVFPDQTGMIGSLFLRDYVPTFDLGNARIAFTPPEQAPPADDLLLVDIVGTYKDRATGGAMILTWDGERVTAVLGAGQPELEVRVLADRTFTFPAAWIKGKFLLKDQHVVSMSLTLPEGRTLRAHKID